MDSLNELIKQAETMLNQVRGLKCDDEKLNVLQDNAFQDLADAKEKLNKTLKDVDSIK